MERGFHLKANANDCGRRQRTARGDHSSAAAEFRRSGTGDGVDPRHGLQRFVDFAPALVATLGLPFRSRGSAVLADGSEIEFDIHTATVIWDGTPRNILVEAADTDPLLGMALLYGYDIRIRAIDGGRVTLRSMTPDDDD